MVSDNTSEPLSAKTIVNATGVNNLPSSPCKVSKGKNTIIIIKIPEVTGPATSAVAR